MGFRVVRRKRRRALTSQTCREIRPPHNRGFGVMLSVLTPSQFLWFMRRVQEEGLLPPLQASKASGDPDRLLCDKH